MIHNIKTGSWLTLGFLVAALICEMFGLTDISLALIFSAIVLVSVLSLTISKPLNEIKDILFQLANGNLQVRMEGNYIGKFAQIKKTLNTALGNLNGILSQVAEGTEQVASASQQISAGSQSLAQGAAEQTNALEEVSTGLQEMNSMIKQNAANAKEAKGLSENAKGTSSHGMESMEKLSEAINKIKVSADSTAKIVRTINEIAFQTNLLALNAAVEAARAGDAGKGFAVVAEEVRSLAMRSAEAAKNTANLIEESVQNAHGGVAINQEVTSHLKQITSQVEKVAEMMAEISVSCDSQALGVEHITKALGQMNQLTQQNAANSEESASAAEELSSQTQTIRAMVNSFKIDSTNREKTKKPWEKPVHVPERIAKRKQSLEKVLEVPSKPNLAKEALQNSANMIPFDEDENVLRSF